MELPLKREEVGVGFIRNREGKMRSIEILRSRQEE
jgi:hypothetical protein